MNQIQIPDTDPSTKLRETSVRKLPFQIDVHKIENAFKIVNLKVGDFANIRLSDLVALRLEGCSIGVIVALVNEAEINFMPETESENWLSKSVVEEFLISRGINLEQHYLHEVIETFYSMPKSDIQKIIRAIELNGIRYKKNIFYDVDLPLHLSGIPTKIIGLVSPQGVTTLRDFRNNHISLFASYEEKLRNILKFYRINLNSPDENQEQVDSWGKFNLAFRRSQPGLHGSIMRSGLFPDELALAEYLVKNKENIPAIRAKIRVRENQVTELIKFAEKIYGIES